MEWFIGLALVVGIIMTFEGGMGSGKSLTITGMTVMQYARSYQLCKKGLLSKPRHIISNMTLYYIPYERITFKSFVEWMGSKRRLRNATVIIDEGYLSFDARNHGSNLNKLWSYLILQVRKRHIDLMIATQQFGNIDLRARQNVHYRVFCSFDDETKICNLKFVRMKNGKKTRRYLYGPHFFKYFLTDEIPEIPQKALSNVNI